MELVGALSFNFYNRISFSSEHVLQKSEILQDCYLQKKKKFPTEFKYHVFVSFIYLFIYLLMDSVFRFPLLHFNTLSLGRIFVVSGGCGALYTLFPHNFPNSHNPTQSSWQLKKLF